MVSATAMIPRRSESFAKNSGVLPSLESSSALIFMSSVIFTCFFMNFMLPARSFSPSGPRAWIPLPGSAVKSLTSGRAVPSAALVTAFARGCSLLLSRAAAILRKSTCCMPSRGMISVTLGSPLVMVPVLSKAMIWVRPRDSRDAAVLYRMPFRAPLPLPAIMATGVASPRAQGQLMTRTEMALAMAKPNSLPAIIHPASVTRAMPITTGTKTPATLSAMRAMGALVAAASDTVFMICERVVSSPTLEALTLIYPDWFMVAWETVSPSSLSTGMLSPVRADSFTAVEPSMITPSTGMLSPGLTATMSPVSTSSMGTSFSDSLPS